jgi:hypothetical protein
MKAPAITASRKESMIPSPPQIRLNPSFVPPCGTKEDR